MKKCFIVCPIGKEGTDTRKRSDTLFKHILNPICKESGFECIRVDNINNASDSIPQTILDNLATCDLVIADLTEHNPNAFYEIGYRSALGKPIIHLKDKNDSIPFDVASLRTFDYDLNNLDAVDELKNRLIQTIGTIPFDEPTETEKVSPSETSFNSQMLQLLFNIQDSIKDLSNKIAIVDNSAISVLADKLVNTRTKSDEAVLIETLIPAILSDPSKFNDLVEIGSKFSNLK